VLDHRVRSCKRSVNAPKGVLEEGQSGCLREHDRLARVKFAALLCACRVGTRNRRRKNPWDVLAAWRDRRSLAPEFDKYSGFGETLESRKRCKLDQPIRKTAVASEIHWADRGWSSPGETHQGMRARNEALSSNNGRRIGGVESPRRDREFAFASRGTRLGWRRANPKRGNGNRITRLNQTRSDSMCADRGGDVGSIADLNGRRTAPNQAFGHDTDLGNRNLPRCVPRCCLLDISTHLAAEHRYFVVKNWRCVVGSAVSKLTRRIR